MAAVPDLTLWGVGTSRTIRAHWAMHELGLPYKTKPIGPRTGETKTAEYTALNPRQKVPLLQDGDFCIGESAAIVAYLSRTYSSPERALIPERQRDYAAWLEWCFFIVTELDSTSLYVMRRHRADALGPIYGIAPEVVAKAGEYFREQLRHVEVALSGRAHIPDGRSVHQRRYPAHDLSRLGDRLRRRHLRQRPSLSRAHPSADRPISVGTAANKPLAPITPVPAEELEPLPIRAKAQPARQRASCSLAIIRSIARSS